MSSKTLFPNQQVEQMKRTNETERVPGLLDKKGNNRKKLRTQDSHLVKNVLSKNQSYEMLKFVTGFFFLTLMRFNIDEAQQVVRIKIQC